MDAKTREFVRRRALLRCEYCRFPDHALELPFHVEQIIAVVHWPDDDPANLASLGVPALQFAKGAKPDDD